MGEQGAFRAVRGLEHQRAGLPLRISGTAGNRASAARERLQGREWMDQNSCSNLQSKMSAWASLSTSGT